MGESRIFNGGPVGFWLSCCIFKMLASLQLDIIWEGRSLLKKIKINYRNLPALIIAPLSTVITDPSRPPPFGSRSGSKRHRRNDTVTFFSSYMCPTIGDKHLHLIDQTFLPMLIVLSILLHPPLYRLLQYPVLNPRRHNPPPKSILPYPPYACSKTGI